MSDRFYGGLMIGLMILGAALIVCGLAGQFYFHRLARNIRRELWRREDARAAGTVPYDADGYEDWTLPIPAIPNVRKYVEKRQRPSGTQAAARGCDEAAKRADIQSRLYRD